MRLMLKSYQHILVKTTIVTRKFNFRTVFPSRDWFHPKKNDFTKIARRLKSQTNQVCPEKKTFDCFAFSRDTNKSEVYIIERYSEIEN